MHSDYISLMDGEEEVYHYSPILGWNSENRRFSIEEIAKFAVLHLDRIKLRRWDMMVISDNGDKINISRSVLDTVQTWRDMLRQGMHSEQLLTVLDNHIEALHSLKPPVKHWETEMAIIVSNNFRNDLVRRIAA